MVDFRLSALWRRRVDGSAERALRVRLWKLHGCLRDLKPGFRSWWTHAAP